MNEIRIIEDRLVAQQDEYLKELLDEPSDDYGNPFFTALGDVLISTTTALRKNLAICIDQLAAATVKIKTLEAKVDTLENREMKFAGRYDKAKSYEKGSVVNYAGSAYVATSDAPPGELPNASGSWAILVKRGRDAAHRSTSRNDIS